MIVSSDAISRVAASKAPAKAATQGRFIHTKPGANGNLSYVVDNTTHSYDLWINRITQEHSLTGKQAQGKMSNHFYPSSYNAGDFQMDTVFSSQLDLQNFGVFVRDHQVVLMQHAGGFDTDTIQNSNSKQLIKLLQLSIPSEGISCRGVIANFHVNRKGVFENTPVYPINFTPLVDKQSPDFKVSSKTIGWYPNVAFEVGTDGNTVSTNTPPAKGSGPPTKPKTHSVQALARKIRL